MGQIFQSLHKLVRVAYTELNNIGAGDGALGIQRGGSAPFRSVIAAEAHQSSVELGSLDSELLEAPLALPTSQAKSTAEIIIMIINFKLSALFETLT